MRIVCIVAAPEGIALVERAIPTSHLHAGGRRGLNEHKYIVPASAISATASTAR